MNAENDTIKPKNNAKYKGIEENELSPTYT